MVTKTKACPTRFCHMELVTDTRTMVDTYWTVVSAIYTMTMGLDSFLWLLFGRLMLDIGLHYWLLDFC